MYLLSCESTILISKNLPKKYSYFLQ
jgi:hypothetical protein